MTAVNTFDACLGGAAGQTFKQNIGLGDPVLRVTGMIVDL